MSNDQNHNSISYQRSFYLLAIFFLFYQFLPCGEYFLVIFNYMLFFSKGDSRSLTEDFESFYYDFRALTNGSLGKHD